jgi:hypothetical protein
MLFLIDYDRSQGRLIELRVFDDASGLEASDARLELELTLSRRGIKREVVLLQAASEADLRRTHRRYFESFAELIEPKQQVQAPNVAEGTADYRTSKDQ